MMKRFKKIMNQRGYVVVMFLLFSFFSFAQQNGWKYAIITDPSDVKDTLVYHLYEKIHKNIVENYSLKAGIYHRDKDGNIVFSEGNKKPEEKVDILIYLKANGQCHTYPDLVIGLDARSYTTGEHYFHLNQYFYFTAYYIDAKTNQFLKEKNITILKEEYKKLFVQEQDYINYLGKQPVVLWQKNREEFSRQSLALINFLQPKLTEVFKSAFNVESTLKSLIEPLFINKEDIFYATEALEFDEDKVTRIRVNAGKKNLIAEDDWFYFYEKMYIEGYSYYEFVSTGKVKAVTDTTCEVGFMLVGKKRLAELLEQGKPIIAVEEFSRFNIFKILNAVPNAPYVNIILSPELQKNIYVQQHVRSSSGLILIHSEVPVTDYFIKLNKRLANQESSANAYIPRTLSMELKNSKFLLTDTTNNELVGSIWREHVVMNKEDVAKKNAKEILAPLFRKENLLDFLYKLDSVHFAVRWLKTTEENKGKINKILIYSPGGLEHWLEFEIYVNETALINGTNVNKPKLVAKARNTFSYTSTVGSLDVYSGGKDLYDLHNQGKELIIKAKLY